jgi:hypothetical protein
MSNSQQKRNAELHREIDGLRARLRAREIQLDESLGDNIRLAARVKFLNKQVDSLNGIVPFYPCGF